MDAAFTLQLFPEQALDNSIITAVLIGLAILLLFTEVFGWSFAGYVVPGYLASIFLTLPESGFAITIEAVLTYSLVWLLSDGGAKLGLWARYFGRERFLLFVYLSVVVRLVMETLIFPRLSFLAIEIVGIPLKNDFFSIGLVLVPLVANTFWKTGMARGVLQTGLVTLLTYLVLLFVVLPYTNLNLSKFELTYENVALNFTESPKLYIILLTGALIASTYNLRYGWDYNGIMMPALIAIAFFYPLKILTTFVESMVVAGLFFSLTRLPWIGKLNFGGGRKILSVFILGFSLKWLLATFLPTLPTLHVTDLFGFGYLLPSLLAVKILQKRNPFLVLLPTFSASLYAVVLGSLFAFGFYLLDENLEHFGETTQPRLSYADAPLPGRMLRDVLTGKAYVLSGAMAESREPKYYQLAYATDAISAVVRDVDPAAACARLAASTSTTPYEDVKLACHRRMDPELGEYVMIQEDVKAASNRQGIGVYFVRPGAKGPLLIVPHPLSEPLAVEAAFINLRLLDARGLFLPGHDEPLSQNRWTNALAGKKTVFHWVFERLERSEVIQVRTHGGAKSTFHARHSLPYSLDLNLLRREIGPIELSWKPPVTPDIEWQSAETLTFGVLELSDSAIYVASPRHKFGGLASRLELPISVTGLIERWVVEQRDFILKAGSATYQPPDWLELTLFENEVFRRFLELAAAPPGEQLKVQLGTIRIIAQFLGYEALWFTDTRTREDFLILKEHREDGPIRGYGTFVLRIGPARPWIWIVPRPLAEPGTMSLAARWYDDFDSRLLVIPGASHRADPFGRNDLLSMAAPRSVTHALLHEFLRQSSGDPALLAIVVRGARVEKLAASLLLSTGDELVGAAELSAASSDLYEDLTAAGEFVELFTGEGNQLGMQGLGTPLSGLARVRQPGSYVTLWISEGRRAAVFEGAQLKELMVSYDALGIPYVFGESDLLERWFSKTPNATILHGLPDADLSELVLDYALHFNTAALSLLAKGGGSALGLLINLRETKVYLAAENGRLRCFATVGEGGLDLAGRARRPGPRA